MAAPDTTQLPAGAIVLPPEGGRTYEMKTLRPVFKADGEETGNRYSISEWVVGCAQARAGGAQT
jgi:hypothetical protein